MFLGLRHLSFIRRAHEQRHIDATDTRQHVANEAFVSRHVDDARLAPAGQCYPGKAEVNRHPSRFFFYEAIWVNTSKRSDERGFPVIHVSRSADATHSRIVAHLSPSGCEPPAIPASA